jgi:hypothetical protein
MTLNPYVASAAVTESVAAGVSVWPCLGLRHAPSLSAFLSG